MEYAALLPRLLQEQIDINSVANGADRHRRLFGKSSFDGPGFADYSSAYVWAKSNYRVSSEGANIIQDCVEVCDDLFEDTGYGTLADTCLLKVRPGA